MSDIFGRTTPFGGAMSADATRMTFAGSQAGLIIQRVEIQYSQTITRLYALEDGKVYFVAGRTNGTMTMQHVVGPAGLQGAFIKRYGDVCQRNGVFKITLQGGCGDTSNRSAVALSNPVISAINMQVSSQDMIIGSGLTMTFVSLDMT